MTPVDDASPTSADRPPVRVDQHGQIRWLTLDRPERRNALDADLVRALDAQVTAADEDPGTAVVVVAGAGPSFCAGGDFRHFLALDRDGIHPVTFLAEVSACFTRIAAAATPWVAALHGHVVAGGLELALVCDLVVAAEDTLIGDGHLRNDLLPAAGSSVRLADAIGRGPARRLLLTGELLPAAELATSGWIDRIVPAHQLETETMAVAAQLAASAGPAQSALKRLTHRIDGLDAPTALQLELDAFAHHWTTQPVSRALEAFLAARTPGGSTR